MKITGGVSPDLSRGNSGGKKKEPEQLTRLGTGQEWTNQETRQERGKKAGEKGLATSAWWIRLKNVRRLG